MRLTRRFLGAAAVGAALAVAFAVPGYAATTHTAAPVQTASIIVQAMPASADCPSLKVCIYANKNFNGGSGTFSGSNADWERISPYQLEERASPASRRAGTTRAGGMTACPPCLTNLE